MPLASLTLSKKPSNWSARPPNPTPTRSPAQRSCGSSCAASLTSPSSSARNSSRNCSTSSPAELRTLSSSTTPSVLSRLPLSTAISSSAR